MCITSVIGVSLFSADTMALTSFIQQLRATRLRPLSIDCTQVQERRRGEREGGREGEGGREDEGGERGGGRRDGEGGRGRVREGGGREDEGGERGGGRRDGEGGRGRVREGGGREDEGGEREGERGMGEGGGERRGREREDEGGGEREVEEMALYTNAHACTVYGKAHAHTVDIYDASIYLRQIFI